MNPTQGERPWLAILLGGGIAATLDIVYACVANWARAGKDPVWVCQSVASGWLGSDAFDSGYPGALLGLASHYSILFVAAALYLAAARRLPLLRSQAVACGAAFGVGIYLFMNFVVLPLSAFPYHLSYPPMRLIEGFASHAMFVGVPIALCIRRFTRP